MVCVSCLHSNTCPRLLTHPLSGGDDDLFTIDGGVLVFREPPNYEDPNSVATGELLSVRNVYRGTVEAAGGTRDVVVRVMDVDEAGTASMDRPQPQVDRALGASLSDEDGVTAERWQWARSEDGRTWTDIEGATSPLRRPAPADVGMYLRATVTYSDKFGSGKTASAVTANPVEAKTLSNAAPSFADQDDDDATAGRGWGPRSTAGFGILADPARGVRGSGSNSTQPESPGSHHAPTPRRPRRRCD